ncbi:MAG TPA: hypothetical protein VD837_07225 [Terriglobales bacterium]|nr:hypothetical protein [Terriglobales bacterium]
MKQVQLTLCAVLLASATAMAQAPAQGGTQAKPAQPPASAQPNTQSGATGAGQSATTPGAQGQAGVPAQAAAPTQIKMPQAKTQEEFTAYQQAVAPTDPAQAEAAADDFATKYKESELRPLLYHRTLQLYQSVNNADKAIELGRKLIALDPNDLVANVMVAQLLAERTRDTDLDKDERLAEAEKNGKRVLQTIDTGTMYTPPDRLEGAKAMIKSMALAALGQVEAVRQNFKGAEDYYKQSLAVPGASTDAITLLQYTLVLDKQRKYQEALVIANKAFEAAPAGSPVQNVVKQERDRLIKLNSAGAPAATTTTPAQQTPPKP